MCSSTENTVLDLIMNVFCERWHDLVRSWLNTVMATENVEMFENKK